MSFTDGSTRMSLFLQVNSISIRELASALEHIRLGHRDPADSDYIYNLVLHEIGYDDGRLRTDALDIIAPYLPGGNRQSFDNVFVGSKVLPWIGPGNAYREGISNNEFRWRNLMLQKDLWTKWVALYGQDHPFHWYIDYEGVLSYLDEWDVRAGMEAYLIQSLVDADEIASGRAVLWSPAVWRPDAMTGAEISGIRSMFWNIDKLAPGKINWLHFQDMLGRGWPGIDVWDVKRWYHQLANLGLFDSLRVNTELFTPSYQPIPLNEYRARMDFYDKHNIPVGSSYELRYWYRRHTEIA